MSDDGSRDQFFFWRARPLSIVPPRLRDKAVSIVLPYRHDVPLLRGSSVFMRSRLLKQCVDSRQARCSFATFRHDAQTRLCADPA